jgi:hypothetical protein
MRIDSSFQPDENRIAFRRRGRSMAHGLHEYRKEALNICIFVVQQLSWSSIDPLAMPLFEVYAEDEEPQAENSFSQNHPLKKLLSLQSHSGSG